MENVKFLQFNLKMPLTKLPVRSSVITLPNAKVLYAPGSGLGAQELQDLGDVTDIVAPNLFHCTGAIAAQRIHPNAKLWGVPRASKIKPEVSWGAVLGKQPWPYDEYLELYSVEGMPVVNEFVMYHKQSKTLFVCDLCFNIQSPKGLGAWMVFKMFGTYDRFGVSRLFLKAVKDRQKFIESIKKILQLDFHNIVMSHGEIVTENAKEKLMNAFAERGYSFSEVEQP